MSALFCRATSDPNPPKLNIQHGRTGTVSIPDVTQTPIVEVGDVDTLMAKAARSKAVAATMMNAQSSRSHCVFTLTLIGTSDCALVFGELLFALHRVVFCASRPKRQPWCGG